MSSGQKHVQWILINAVVNIYIGLNDKEGGAGRTYDAEGRNYSGLGKVAGGRMNGTAAGAGETTYKPRAMDSQETLQPDSYDSFERKVTGKKRQKQR